MNIISNVFRLIPNEKVLAEQIVPTIPTLMGQLVIFCEFYAGKLSQKLEFRAH